MKTNKPSKRIVKKGKNTYVGDRRVNVYGRHAAYLMFQKEFEELTEEELREFERRYGC